MTPRPAEVVTDFYRAIVELDADALTAAITEHFAEDAAIEWPASLPHGGRITGHRRLKAVFAGSAQADPPAGVTNLTVNSIIGDGDAVVASLAFDWKHPGGGTTPNSALELWQFTDGKVDEIRAFYWDTDAISRPAHKDQ